MNDNKDLIERLLDGIPWVIIIGATLGVLFTEYLYFTKAEHVRLLFVLFLIPVGAVGGAVVTLVAYLAFIALAYISIYVALAALALGMLKLVVELLYDTVLWSN